VVASSLEREETDEGLKPTNGVVVIVVMGFATQVRS
jgi:hypothetical protein